MDIQATIKELGLNANDLNAGTFKVYSPIDGQAIASLQIDTPESINEKITLANKAFLAWRLIPPPQRGELIRLFGEELRKHKQALGKLVTIECGKILSEGMGEVQEMIDICDFAVGLSRQLYGLTIASERPAHKMLETWQPLGVCGVISAFNFPVAVWAWNFAIAIVCGDPVIWKPSEKTPVTALACLALFQRAAAKFQHAPEGLMQVIIGDHKAGEQLADSPQIPLLSATGSVAMGREVGPRVARRFGKTLLELGGNNAMIVTPSADLDLALRAIVFAAAGTAGQRCTSLRRLIVHKSIYRKLINSIKQSYAQIPVGNPLDESKLVGPLIDRAAFETMQSGLEVAKTEGSAVIGGARVLVNEYPDAYYVQPALIEAKRSSTLLNKEIFAPLLHCLEYEQLDQAIQMHNDVPQGLASSIFTNDLREAEQFLAANGSDCGIANVNIGPSGAEIGGAFGGEKETGGGRESGSDAWKAYMRRQTSTINYSSQLPLAQGVKFEI